MKRSTAILVGVGLLLGFGGGFLFARALPPGHAAAGQGFVWPFFGKPRAANAPRGEADKPDGFAVWKTRIDSSGADPLSCIRMTKALNSRQNYGDFVLVAPDLGHPVTAVVHGDELCIPGLGFSGHQITLLKGLPAGDGETLADNVDVDMAGGDKPPYVGFDGLGVILPREEADGVGIDTVNVSKLAIEVWRVPDRNLVRKSISAPDPTSEGEYSSDYGEDSAVDAGRIVWSGDMPVKAPAGQRAVTVFPLGSVLKDLQPGAYVVSAKDASGVPTKAAKPAKGEEDSLRPASARRWILFTDMGLATYEGTDGLDVVVRSLKTAQVMPGVRVALVAKDGEDLSAVASDAQGRVHFARALLDGDNAAKAKMVMAYGPKADFTVLDLERSPVDLSSQSGTGRSLPGAAATTGRDAATSVDGFLYADRGIYRPGETVHVVAMLRDRLAHAIKDRKGALVIKRPSGTEFRRLRFDNTPTGAMAQDIVLPASAPRGKWTATLQMDGSDESSGDVDFDVEDFAPQRLAVTVTGDAAHPVGPKETRRIDIAARFLYGADGAGLQTQAEARISADADPFPRYKDYRWGDETKPFEEKLVQLPETVTDGAGHAAQMLDTTQVADATAPLEASIKASVFEPGGRPVSESLSLKVRPRAVYLGVKATSAGQEGNPTQTYEVIAVDANGRRIAVPGVTYALIAENWSYDWYEEGGRWSWRRSSHDTPLAKGVFNLGVNGSGRVSRRLPWGDYRLVVDDPASGAHAVVRQASGWGTPAKDEEAPDTARVSTPENRTYAPGDGIDVHIAAPFAGEAQIAVATDRVIDLRTATIPKGGGVVHLKSSAAWGGGAYVLVSVMQPRDPSLAPKPRRALGLVYVPLEPKGRKLTVSFGSPAKQASTTPVTIPLTVHGLHFASRAHVTVAAVDEGILRLTHEESPDPVDWYFGRRALAVDYRDDYGRLLNANLGAAAALNYGGDASVGGEGLTATPIKTVALWSGVVDTGLDGKAVIHLPAAAYNGQLRLMAVAWTDDQVGGGQAPLLVREPVVAELSLPRFLAPGDQALATLELHNVEAQAGAYLAEVFGQNGPLAPLHKLYNLLLGQRTVDHVTMQAANRPGVGSIHLKVTGPGFATANSYPIQTRVGWDALTRATIALQRPGDVFTPAPDLLAGLSPGGLSMSVSYSPFRGFDPTPIAEALSRYPYGCTEQIVSAAEPLIYAQEITGDPKFRRVPSALTDAVAKILDRQGLDGAFGLWKPGDEEADAWLGAYTVDFLLDARAAGVAVPDDAMARALKAMRLLSRPQGSITLGYELEYPKTWGKTPEETAALTEHLRSRAAAYALYVMAKAKTGDLARLRWFHDVQFKDEPAPLARAQVGAGLAFMGDKARAHDSFVQAVQALGYREPTDWYQSVLRDTAAVISLAYEAGELDIARRLQTRLENAVKDPDALNTQEQAQLVKAAHAMLIAAGPMRIDAVGVRPNGPTRWAVGRLADARFVNRSHGALWRTVTVHGLPTSAPGADGHGLRLEKRYFTLQGAPVDPATLTQGAQVIVRLSGGSDQERSMMAVIDDPLPAGFEVESTVSPADAAGETDDEHPAAAKKGPFAFLGTLSTASVEEKRDDRYVAALTISSGKSFALAYIARAVTPGDFFLPGAHAQDMYRPSVSAHTVAGRIKIAPH